MTTPWLLTLTDEDRRFIESRRQLEREYLTKLVQQGDEEFDRLHMARWTCTCGERCECERRK